MRKYSMMIALFIMSAATLYAQTSSFTTSESDLSPDLLYSNSKCLIYNGILNSFVPNAFDGNRSVLYINHDQAVVAVSHKENSFNGICKYNSKGRVVWKTRIPGILGISKYGAYILVTSTDYLGFDCWSNITISLIDTTDGNETDRKVIYKRSATEGAFEEPKVLNDTSGIFHGILVMQSKYMCNDPKKYKNDEIFTVKDQMKGASVFYPDENSNWPSHSLDQSAFSGSGAAYAGAAVNTKGDIFLCGMSNGKLFVEKYTSGQNKPEKTLQTDFEASINQYFSGVVTALDDNTVGITIKTEKEKNTEWLKEAVFDFAQQAVFFNNTVLDKALAKSSKISQADNLEVESFLKYKDKYITIKQVEYKYIKPGTSMPNGLPLSPSFQEYYAGDIIVSIYNKQMSLLENVTLNKDYGLTFTVGFIPGIKVIDNNLYIIYNAVPKVMIATSHRYSKVARLSLDNPESFEVTELDREDLEKDDVMEPSLALWFGKTALVPYYRVDAKKSSEVDKLSGIIHIALSSFFQAVRF